ncbi:hypothetical protein N8I77_010088 [Diaporthe amygdali]|uniref:NACHT domain-containing protein n=1 Tax=Phomopsis amygdali TaxID=1214568 RepID=A0AAD9W0M6_PHOAM|nr:hypothetical protein N8I77_010088 [Diaporthe amygdali]
MERLEIVFSFVDTIKQTASTSLWDPENIARIGAILPKIRQDGNKIRREQEVIKSLNYQVRKFRYEAIQDAHIRTFEWVFSSGHAHGKILTWLENDVGIFWVSGKPGSGKSTLMKFIVDDPRTREALASWAGSKSCVTASHFFWISGATAQTSQEGLFRSLLYEILRERPQLVESLYPSLWEQAGGTNPSEQEYDQIWSRRSLRNIISRLKDYRDDDTKFCFFIDGLDEYKGDHLDMVKTLEELVLSESIKVCVSSRPWNVFADAFGNVPTRKISVQDLAHNDLVAYAQDKLGQHHLWEELTHEVQKQIVGTILQKAQGVFLWVYLVVKQLREGLSNGDTVEVLQQRVRDFPPDLEEFFSRMMASIDRLYLPHTARAFQVALHALNPLPTLLYSFLDDEKEDEQYALRLPRQRFDDEALERRIGKIPRLLEARCKGLLEIVISEDPLYGEQCLQPRVEFIHRTARDFLRTRQMADLLEEGAAGFEPYSSILRAYVAGIKAVKAQRQPKTWGNWGERKDVPNIVLDALAYAYRAEKQANVVENAVLGELAATLQEIKRLQGGAMAWLDELVIGVPGVPYRMVLDPGPNPDPFHVLVLRSGLMKYFADLKDLQYTACGASLLLICIIHLHFQHRKYGSDIYGSTMAVLDKATETIHTLPDIHRGNDYPKSLGMLDMLHTTPQPTDQDARFQVIKALIEFGGAVYSSSAPQVWDFLLDSVLYPHQELLTDTQITDLLVLAIETGAQLDPNRIIDMRGAVTPFLYSRITRAWEHRFNLTGTSVLSQDLRRNPDNLRGSDVTRLVDKQWFRLILACFYPYCILSLWMYANTLQPFIGIARGAWRLGQSIVTRAALYLHNFLY